MYLGIDIGGTKTLAAVFSDEGALEEQIKFPTPKKYDEFLQELTKTIRSFKTQDFRAGCVAAPGALDRPRGRVINFGNLPWTNVPLLKNVETISHCPMLLENDAKLAGLGEAVLLKEDRVLYVTISTGIGYGLVVGRVIESGLSDAGGRNMMLEHHGKLVPWESYASGSAIVQRFGKRASEIDDAETWKTITRDLVPGFLELIAILHPEIIVIGGGVGHYLEKFHDSLVDGLKRYETPMLKIPPIVEAQRPDEAVIYGCYDLARDTYLPK
ncbi:MAG: ROK family protein [Candidatus Saccharimonadales bacterium]